MPPGNFRVAACYEASMSKLLYRSVNSIYGNWNANLPAIWPGRSEAKVAAHGGIFCRSVLALFAVLCVSSSHLPDFNLQFC